MTCGVSVNVSHLGQMVQVGRDWFTFPETGHQETPETPAHGVFPNWEHAERTPVDES